MGRYKIEFELPDNETVINEIIGQDVYWMVWGFGGHAKAERATDVRENVRGKWDMKPDPYGFFDKISVCSECGMMTKMRETYNFCPNCGADMREE